MEYDHELGLPTLKTNINECESLNLTGAEIAALSPEERDEHAADLASYAVYIQRTISKERALVRWLESKINLSIADELNDYQGYYSHEQRRAIAVKGNGYAKQLEEYRMNAQMKVDTLDGLTYQINQMFRVLSKEKVRNTWQN